MKLSCVYSCVMRPFLEVIWLVLSGVNHTYNVNDIIDQLRSLNKKFMFYSVSM